MSRCSCRPQGPRSSTARATEPRTRAVRRSRTRTSCGALTAATLVRSARRYCAPHERRPHPADRGSHRPAQAGPRDRRQGAAPAVRRGRGHRDLPARGVPHAGRAGLLGLPYPEEYGGGGQPYEVYLQVVEEIAAVWASVGVGVSVHALSCFGLATVGTRAAGGSGCPTCSAATLLGAYCLSEAHAGSDPAAMSDARSARRRRLRASTARRPGPPTAATPTSTR